jgi:ubiquinone/menaquinone biosynthesis C-methylase UbiE
MINEDKAWVEYREKFADVYDESNYASPLQSAVMRASHKLTERAFDKTKHFGRVLEVGAGTGEHFPFVRHSFDQYILSDLDVGTLERAKKKLSGTFGGEVVFDIQSGAELNYPDNSFDRVVAVHVLEHIYQPHLVLKEWRRVLKPNGVLSVLIPTDPGVAWRLGRNIGPRKRAMAQGIAYDYVMAREHVNPCNNLIALLRHYFPNAKEQWWPFPIASIDLNLFFSFNAVVKKQDEVN